MKSYCTVHWRRENSHALRKAGTQAELVLEANGADVQFTLPQGVELVDTADNRYAFVYQYEGLKSILVETEGEATYRIVIVTTDMAGRTWAHHDDQGDALTIGLDYVLYQRGESGSLSVNYEQEQIFADYYVWNPTQGGDGFQRGTVSRESEFVSLPAIDAGTMANINALEQGKVDHETQSLGDAPMPLEEVDFFKGHFLYEADIP